MSAPFQPEQSRDWIVCQIGAREHYYLAAELNRRGRLVALCTDVWASSGSTWRTVAALAGARGRHIRERWRSDLDGARVLAERPEVLVVNAIRQAAAGLRAGWPRIMTTNRRFARSMAYKLVASGLLSAHKRPAPVVFAYSYGALEILAAAKAAGCPTVLGQIDPGPEEQALVAAQTATLGFPAELAASAPEAYWSLWREELALADLVLVNSRWSAELLARAGAPVEKLRVTPLAYEVVELQPPRNYPHRFSVERPLELLFLGQANLRKGLVELVEAMKRLTDAPVRLSVVGPVQSGFRERLAAPATVLWTAPAARGETAHHYREADMFLLPTHSDGFAITQLEALSHGLPVVASRCCGEVIEDGRQGRLLKAVTPEAIEAMIRWSLAHPKALGEMAARAPERLQAFAPARIVDELLGHIEDVR